MGTTIAGAVGRHGCSTLGAGDCATDAVLSANVRARPVEVGACPRSLLAVHATFIGAHLPDMLPTSSGVGAFAIEPSCRADPMKQALSAQVPGPARIHAWFEGVVSAASKLSSMPTPAGSLKANWVWFRTGTLLIV